MNAAVLLQLLRGAAIGQRVRLALTLSCIALGVALAGAVHTLHASALTEVDRAARTLAGSADLEIRGPRSGFDEALFPKIARHPEVLAASPVVELEASLANGKDTLHVMGVDPFRAARLQPGFLVGEANFSWAAEGLDSANAWLTPSALARLGVKVGGTVALRSGPGTVELHVAGVLPRLDAGGEIAVIDIASAQERFDRLGKLSRIDLRLRAGVDAEAFRVALAAELPPGVVAMPPAAISGRAASLTRAYRVNLNALASMALLTGLFLVFSTLALQAARRREEYALLRALGVTRGGLARLVLVEGLLVGLAGAAIGTLGGLAVSRVVLERFGTDLGSGYFRGIEATFAPDPWALSAIAFLGIATSLAGAWAVARSASRVEIASALRERAHDLPAGDRHALPVALGLIVAGVPFLWAPPVGGLPLGGYTTIALWLAASALLVPPACRALLARFAPTRDPIAHLAAAQFRHLPGHLAASVAGIVVSASLCAAMVVMVHSFRVSLDRWLTSVIGADLYVRGAEGDTVTFSPEQQRAIAALPQLARVDVMRYDRLTLGADVPQVTLLARTLDDRVLRGFQAEPASRPENTKAIPVWVSEAAVDLHGWRKGEPMTLPIGGRSTEVFVVGTFRDFARTWGAVLMDIEDYRRLTGDLAANDLAVDLTDRARTSEAQAAIRLALADAPALRIEDATGLHQRSLDIFDRTFAATYALEAVALVISLAGLTSSFAAIAWSRRREFGVLRHLGLRRRDVLRMLTVEGAVAGTLGAAIGLASGAAISVVLVQVVNRQSFHWGMEVHWPFAALVALATALVVACAIGARWSAHAAVREEAVRAVRDDA
ncbi:hypothetical protein DSM104443_02394 [Usitatibacter rugosus]|uniref:ABC transport system permease protein n=1 Tax=Usitatibacter rugosus TaxID=2732067 RepID=A0A6M4GVN3_9PROT|nr:ABC transporter permease [Usitatibacter rugosus]QJR11319.1 hypothetical protein DSM104443_02394 [Usitatibacter rugosus]